MTADTKARVRDLLQEAINLLQESNGPTTSKPAKADQSDEETITLTGAIGRPVFKEVKGIALHEAGLGLKRIDGTTEWISIQSWRGVALFANQNLDRGTLVEATGKWKTNEWQTSDGELKSKQIFIVSNFALDES